MRVIGIVLIILGILMFVFSGFNYTTEKNVADIGPLKINKEENHRFGWPIYAGGVTLLAGVILLLAGKKKMA